MLNRYYIWLLGWTLAATLNSCSKDDTYVPEESVSITLTLSMPHPEAGTRAEYEAEPFGNDYHISPEDVEVLIYNTDGTFKDRAVQQFVIPSSTYHEYYLNCRLEGFEKEDLGKSYKIVILANLQGDDAKVSLPVSIESLTEEQLYPYLVANISNSKTLTEKIINKHEKGIIPMWGSQTAIINGFNIPEIDLMRAFAKVEVRLSKYLLNQGYLFADSDENQVRNCQNSGYLTPHSAHNAQHTEATYQQGTEYSTLNPYTLGRASNASFVKHTDGALYIYLPEQRPNDAPRDLTKLHMNVVVKNSRFSDEGKGYPFVFANYNSNGMNPTTIPVRRNHHYKFNLTLLSPLLFKVEVTPFEPGGTVHIEM